MGPWVFTLIVFLLILCGAILFAVFYLKNLQDTLKEVGISRRQVPPSNVWLMFIPLFNLIYPFILYPKICNSLKAEFQHRGYRSNGDYGKSIGIAMPILNLVYFISIPIPIIGSLCSIGHFVLTIVFWNRMAGYKNHLRRTPIGVTQSEVENSEALLDS